MVRSTARASLSASRRGALGLPILSSPGFLVGAMAVVSPGRRELAKLVTHHVLGYRNRNMFLAIVDAEGQAHKLRQDRGATAPHLDHIVAPTLARLLGLLQEIAVDKRAFPS